MLILPFGTYHNHPIWHYQLSNRNGAEAWLCSYGATLTRLVVPDREGNPHDWILGYDTLEEYVSQPHYISGVIGRYANRIAKGQFILEGQSYTLECNNGENHLHGGVVGFDKQVWKTLSYDGRQITFQLVSPDGAEGYPGAVTVLVHYELNDDNQLRVLLSATSDKATILNLTLHHYFNLNGADTILNHELMIPATHFTPVDATLIPTGERRSVANTPFDFRQPTPIGARLYVEDDQLGHGKGYDHNWILRNDFGALALAAVLHEPTTGRQATISTTAPGIQMYAGNYLYGVGRGGVAYNGHAGVALEPQSWPDAPNQPTFPSPIVRAGESYSHEIVYQLEW